MQNPVSAVEAVAGLLKAVPRAPEPHIVGDVCGHGEKHGFNTVSFKHRFFRMDPDGITYFASEGSRSPKGRIHFDKYTYAKPTMLGEPRASNAVANVLPGNVDRLNGMAVLADSRCRTYYLFFSTAKEVERWVDAVNRNAELHRRRKGSIEQMVEDLKTGPVPSGLTSQHVSAMIMALRSRYRPDLGTNNSQHELLHAIEALGKGDLKAVDDCLENIGVDDQTSHGTSLLHRAATLGQTQAVQLLLHRGANPNLAGPDGDTPLLIACRLNFPTIVKVLLEAKADATISNKLKESCIGEAERHNSSELLSLLDAHTVS